MPSACGSTPAGYSRAGTPPASDTWSQGRCTHNATSTCVASNDAGEHFPQMLTSLPVIEDRNLGEVPEGPNAVPSSYTFPCPPNRCPPGFTWFLAIRVQGCLKTTQ